MSHHQEIICPNCGFHATNNYCAQCGQETHLHKDTFFGLVFHFVGHYFHYDSKFWQTLKALVFKPGKLTIAYRNKQRMRYIPPISLYIFVSAVFFLLFFLFSATHKNLAEAVKVKPVQEQTAEERRADSLQKVQISNAMKKLNIEKEQVTAKNRQWITNAANFFRDEQKTEEFLAGLVHFMPKAFFFMIPFMAAMLSLFYLRRKDVHFVDHTIFSLHIHSFIFILLPISLINVPDNGPNFFQLVISFLQDIIPFACALYFVVALRKVYGAGWLKSIWVLLATAVSYFIVFLVLFVIYALVLFANITSSAA